MDHGLDSGEWNLSRLCFFLHFCINGISLSFSVLFFVLRCNSSTTVMSFFANFMSLVSSGPHSLLTGSFHNLPSASVGFLVFYSVLSLPPLIGCHYCRLSSVFAFLGLFFIFHIWRSALNLNTKLFLSVSASVFLLHGFVVSVPPLSVCPLSLPHLSVCPQFSSSQCLSSVFLLSVSVLSLPPLSVCPSVLLLSVSVLSLPPFSVCPQSSASQCLFSFFLLSVYVLIFSPLSVCSQSSSSQFLFSFFLPSVFVPQVSFCQGLSSVAFPSVSFLSLPPLSVCSHSSSSQCLSSVSFSDVFLIRYGIPCERGCPQSISFLCPSTLLFLPVPVLIFILSGVQCLTFVIKWMWI